MVAVKRLRGGKIEFQRIRVRAFSAASPMLLHARNHFPAPVLLTVILMRMRGQRFGSEIRAVVLGFFQKDGDVPPVVDAREWVTA